MSDKSWLSISQAIYEFVELVLKNSGLKKLFVRWKQKAQGEILQECSFRAQDSLKRLSTRKSTLLLTNEENY